MEEDKMKRLIKEILSLVIIGLLIGTLPLGTNTFLLAQEIVKPIGRATTPTNFISLDFQDASLKDVLKIFSQQSGLNFVANEAVKDKKVTLYLEKVSVQDALYNIIEANQLAYKQAEGSNIFIVGEIPKDVEVPTITKIYTLRYCRLSSSILEDANSRLSGTTSTLSGSLSAMGTSGGTGSTTGGTTSGGGGGGAAGGTKGIDKVIEKLLSSRGSLAIDERTNSLIITDVSAQFERIEAAIKQLDIPTLQVVIESEILETSQEAIDKLGIEFGGTTGTIFNAAGAGTSEPFPFSERARTINATAPTINLGYLSFNNLTAVMQALATDTDTKLLARPRIITLNNESAVINITSQTAVASLTQTTTAEGTAVSTEQTPERVTTGVILTITPQINDDGYITMLVAPEVTVPVASEFFPTQFVDPQTRSARSIIRIKDGDTIVIGGLLKEDVTKVRRKVPILGDVPILGLLFTKIQDTVKTKELVVFITPRIIYDEKTLKKEVAAVSPSKKIEVTPAPIKPAAKEAVTKEAAPKEAAPKKEAVTPPSREEAIERALDQLSQSQKIRKDNHKPTDQI